MTITFCYFCYSYYYYYYYYYYSVSHIAGHTALTNREEQNWSVRVEGFTMGGGGPRSLIGKSCEFVRKKHRDGMET